MTQVMHARPATIARAPQTDLAGQAPKNTMNVLLRQSTASLRYEELCAAARSEMTVAPFGVPSERCAGRRMQGYEARLAELPLSDRQNTILEVNVTKLQAGRLSQCQAQ
jgi:hypothetical protein